MAFIIGLLSLEYYFRHWIIIIGYSASRISSSNRISSSTRISPLLATRIASSTWISPSLAIGISSSLMIRISFIVALLPTTPDHHPSTATTRPTRTSPQHPRTLGTRTSPTLSFGHHHQLSLALGCYLTTAKNMLLDPRTDWRTIRFEARGLLSGR